MEPVSSPRCYHVCGQALLYLFATALFIIGSPIAAAQDDAEAVPTVAPLFASDAPLLVTIEAPLTTLMEQRPKKEYLHGTLSYTADDGTQHNLDLKIRTRGKFRWKKKHCDFAPIRLNFRKKQVAGTVFSGQDKLKLVTHCKNRSPKYEQLVLREFLAYRFLNVLTDASFRVRLMRINYIDTEGPNSMTKVGFLIEDDEDVAKRNRLYTIKTGEISYDDIDAKVQNFVNVFQYMIRNTEFSLVRAEPNEFCCHNIDLMSATKGVPFTPIPYDFDFSGMVNAPYAAPNPRLEIQSVRQRLFRGLCANNELLPHTLQRFIDNRDAVFGVVDNVELLSSRTRRDVTRDLNQFYDRISQAKSVDASFIKRCNEDL